MSVSVQSWFVIEKDSPRLDGAISRAKISRLFVQTTSQFRVYVVTNRQSGTRYITTFGKWTDGTKIGRCSCPATSLCKHLAAALPLHLHVAKQRQSALTETN